jgi:hypothetical protein
MKFLCVLGALCGLAISVQALDREAFTFTKYDLNVRIEPEQQRLAVRGKLTLRNDSGVPQKNIALQISSSLDWRSISAGNPVQFVSQRYTSDIDHTGALSEAIVTLPQAVPPQGTIELDIGYEGVVILDTTRLTRIGVPGDAAKHTDWDQISPSFTAVRGIGYVAWYPVATEAASLSEADSVFETLNRWRTREAQSGLEIKLSYSGESSESPPNLLCNNGRSNQEIGEEFGRSQLATMECRFVPPGTVVPLFAIGHYDKLERPALAIFYLPAYKSAAENYAQATERVAPFVASWFGAKRQSAQVVELPDSAATPYESGTMLLTPLDAVDPGPAEIAAVHQLTHAAFPSPRPWIYEGLAHFAQALYRESQAGRRAALDSMGLQLRAVMNAEKSLAQDKDQQAESAGESLVNTPLEEFYRSKAMYVWWMLRDMVGEPALRRALAAYRPDQDKEPSYVQRLIEAQNQRDLEWFFDDWVYRDRGLPDFRVESVYPRQTMQGLYLVTVTIQNLGGAGAEVPITLRFKDGQVSKRLQVRGKSHNSIRIEVPSPPQEVVVDDGSVPESDMTNNLFKVQPGAEAH